jgi:hypothetical protein
VRDLLVTMKVDQAKALAERLALTGRKVCGCQMASDEL